MQEVTNILSLRHATDADRDFLISVFASTRELELQALASNSAQVQIFIDLQFNAQQQSYAAAHPAAENNIISVADRPIGRMLVDRSGDTIHLVDIAILPDYRNQGVGAELIGGLLAEGSTTGRAVVLSVFHTNPAIHLYNRLGFSKVDEESLYWKMRWLPKQAAFKTSISNPGFKGRSLMADQLTYEGLTNNLNSKFTVCLENDHSFDLELIKLSERMLSSVQDRYSFVLLGPNEKFLGQGMRHIRHEVLGELDLFLVPIGQNESGTSYEVVFNCLIKKNDAGA